MGRCEGGWGGGRWERRCGGRAGEGGWAWAGGGRAVRCFSGGRALGGALECCAPSPLPRSSCESTFAFHRYYGGFSDVDIPSCPIDYND